MSTARTGRSTKLLVMQRDEMVKTTAVDVQRLGRQHLLGLPGGPSTGVQTHQGTRSHENGARGHPIRSPPLGMAAGCSAPFPNLKATDEPGRLTVGSSSEEQEEQQQQEGPLQPRVTPGARRRKRSPYDSTHLCPPQHPSGWGPEGKQSPAGLRHKTPTPRVPGSAGQPLSGVRRVFPNASPIPASHHHAHLERGMPPERGPAPVRRCQAAASPENSHPTNRTAGRETEPQAGARQRCALRPQGWSRSGDKTPPPHEGTARLACGERRYSREEGCCWKPPRRPSTHPGR